MTTWWSLYYRLYSVPYIQNIQWQKLQNIFQKSSKNTRHKAATCVGHRIPSISEQGISRLMRIKTMLRLSGFHGIAEQTCYSVLRVWVTRTDMGYIDILSGIISFVPIWPSIPTVLLSRVHDPCLPCDSFRPCGPCTRTRNNSKREGGETANPDVSGSSVQDCPHREYQCLYILKNGLFERLKMPELQVQVPQPPDDAHLLVLLDMDGS